MQPLTIWKAIAFTYLQHVYEYERETWLLCYFFIRVTWLVHMRKHANAIASTRLACSWIWTSHVTHINQSGMSHVTDTNKSEMTHITHIYKSGMSRAPMDESGMSHVTHIHNSEMSQVSHINTSGMSLVTHKYELGRSHVTHPNSCSGWYRVAKTHRIPYLYRSFFAKVTYI